MVPESVAVVEILEKETRGNQYHQNAIEIKAVPPHTQDVRSLVVKQDLIKSLKIYPDPGSQSLTVFVILTEKFNKCWGFFDSNKPFWVSAKSKDPGEQIIILWTNKDQRNILKKIANNYFIGEKEITRILHQERKSCKNSHEQF